MHSPVHGGRAFRHAVTLSAVAAATACGSPSHTAQDALADAAGSQDAGVVGESQDGGQASDTATSGPIIDGGAADVDAVFTDAANSNGDAEPRDAAPGVQGAGTFHGVNWADIRDNYVNGLLQLSGLDASADTNSTVHAKAEQILAQFRAKVGANAIRIPINEPTVSSPWWNAYKAVIDTATADGMKVVVAYWAYHNGKPDIETAFQSMWQTVVSEYTSNDLVYFDIHNEPYGFGTSWSDEAARWLAYFPGVPRGRVVVAGTGYDDDVAAVGGDARFAGCLLELHIYGFWHTTWTTTKQWTDSMTSALGGYASRTIVGEWGDTMNTGINYDVDAADGNNQISYVASVSDYMHSAGMGSCYWPGLRDGDGYSMTTLKTSGTTLTLSIVNQSGLDRLHWAWNL